MDLVDIVRPFAWGKSSVALGLEALARRLNWQHRHVLQCDAIILYTLHRYNTCESTPLFYKCVLEYE